MKTDAFNQNKDKILRVSTLKPTEDNLPKDVRANPTGLHSKDQEEDLSNTYVILNPVAGMTDAHLARRRIGAAMQSRQVFHEIYETGGGDDLPKVIQLAMEQGFNRFLAVGGDGTVAAVAGALVNSGYPVGIVPAGTANALARELHIPLDFNQALGQALDSSGRRQIDAIRVGETCYFLNISVGVYLPNHAASSPPGEAPFRITGLYLEGIETNPGGSPPTLLVAGRWTTHRLPGIRSDGRQRRHIGLGAI